MARTLTDKQIEDKCKDIENKIKSKGKDRIYRKDVQDIINRIIYDVSSLRDLDEQIGKLVVDRAGVEEFGVKTFLTPRQGREHLYEENITLKFVKDLRSYLKVNKRFPNG